MASQTTLPSIEILFRSSWKQFQRVWISLLVFYLIAGAILIVAAVLFGIILVIAGMSHLIGPLSAGNMLFTSPQLWTGVGIFLLIGILILFFLAVFVQLGTILIAASNGRSIRLGEIISKSISLILPIALIRVLTFFFVAGSFFLFIIPGIVVAIFLTFAAYEGILNNQRALSALSRSFAIVSYHFWEILGRVLLLVVIGVVLSILPTWTLNHLGLSSLDWLVTFLRIAFSWFSLCYTVTLYQQAETTVPATRKASLLPLGIMAILGWIIAVFLIYTLVQVAPVVIQGLLNAQKRRIPPNRVFMRNSHPNPYRLPVQTN